MSRLQTAASQSLAEQLHSGLSGVDGEVYGAEALVPSHCCTPQMGPLPVPWMSPCLCGWRGVVM
jgi:hypothetical protein